jgi:hypothetical protein
MSLLSINKIYKIIEMSELIYGTMGYGRTNQPETFIDKLSYYLEDLNITGRCSINMLQKYIHEFSEEEKVEVIALMWLGITALGEQAENFPNLLKQVVGIIPQNYATSYIGSWQLLVI